MPISGASNKPQSANPAIARTGAKSGVRGHKLAPIAKLTSQRQINRFTHQHGGHPLSVRHRVLTRGGSEDYGQRPCTPHRRDAAARAASKRESRWT